jgi:hypothetical protein
MSTQPNEQARGAAVLFHLDDEEGLTEEVLSQLLVLWDETLDAFAVDRVMVVDLTRSSVAAHFQPKAGRREWARFGSLEEAEAAYPDAVWIYFELGGEPLDRFEHPDDGAIYVFGPNSTGLALEPGKRYVEIPMPRPTGLFSLQAASIVLYDRIHRPTS